MKTYETKVKQMELLTVKEDERHVPAKRVDIVSLRLVKETSLLYKDRAIRSPQDGYNLFKQFLGELDREYFVVMCLDVKNQPIANNVCHIGSFNASIVYPREVMKTAILSNASSILVLHNHPSGQPEPSQYFSMPNTGTSPYIFLSKRYPNQPISAQDIRNKLRWVARQAGLDPSITPHTLRQHI